MSCLIEKQLPFSCQVKVASERDGYAEQNDLVFALLECLAEGVSIQRHQDFSSDMQRLEHKLNLVIFMMNNLLQPVQSRPEPQTLRLDTESIAWPCANKYAMGTKVHIELYLHPMIPIPLVCTVQVEACQDGWCRASLLGLSEDAMSSWSRWVFRQHRQFVAQSREQGEHPKL